MGIAIGNVWLVKESKKEKGKEKKLLLGIFVWRKNVKKRKKRKKEIWMEYSISSNTSIVLLFPTTFGKQT